MFKPKTFLDICMAMKTRAEVDMNDGRCGTVETIEWSPSLDGFWITIQPPMMQDPDYASPRGCMIWPESVQILFRE